MTRDDIKKKLIQLKRKWATGIDGIAHRLCTSNNTVLDIVSRDKWPNFNHTGRKTKVWATIIGRMAKACDGQDANLQEWFSAFGLPATEELLRIANDANLSEGQRSKNKVNKVVIQFSANAAYPNEVLETLLKQQWAKAIKISNDQARIFIDSQTTAVRKPTQDWLLVRDNGNGSASITNLPSMDPQEVISYFLDKRLKEAVASMHPTQPSQ
ncbi:MAG: hypothetical protein L6Q57_07405 [Alphaproteobacteria bacterium]|nr:hypothetical protein [Alphaproteobacteria bacterium]